VLKTGSECSFITHKLRFSACFCLVPATSKTFFNGLLAIGKIAAIADWAIFRDAIHWQANGKAGKN
jgi:hypothetical protein